MLYFTIAFTLQQKQRVMYVQVFLDSANTFPPHASMGGFTLYTNKKSKCSGLRWNKLESGWFANKGSIAFVATEQAGKGTKAPILFANHALQAERASQGNT